MSLESVAEPYQVVLDDYSVWQQGNMLAGNMAPGRSDDWEQNLKMAVSNLANFTTASQVLRVRTAGNTVDFIDMDIAPKPTTLLQPLQTQGLITQNPEHIIFANPGDCGEIAVRAVTPDEQPVIGLFHASRVQVDRKSYLKSLEYLCDSRDLNPEDLVVRISPSARVESYAFDTINDAQKKAQRWDGYIKQDGQKQWHVDFHERMMDDLRDFGIKNEQMWVSPDDTARQGSQYYSYRRQVMKQQAGKGMNGLLFALRNMEATNASV